MNSFLPSRSNEKNRPTPQKKSQSAGKQISAKWSLPVSSIPISKKIKHRRPRRGEAATTRGSGVGVWPYRRVGVKILAKLREIETQYTKDTENADIRGRRPVAKISSCTFAFLTLNFALFCEDFHAAICKLLDIRIKGALLMPFAACHEQIHGRPQKRI
jgi:hypothetical protein